MFRNTNQNTLPIDIEKLKKSVREQARNRAKQFIKSGMQTATMRTIVETLFFHDYFRQIIVANIYTLVGKKSKTRWY